MFNAYLLYADSKGKTWVDLEAPVVAGDDLEFVIAKVVSLQDDNHVGFQVFDTQLWEFSEIVLFTDFLIE